MALDLIIYTDKSLLDLFKHREQTACRGNFACSTQSLLAFLIGWLGFLGFYSNIFLALDLGIECHVHAVKAEMLDLARYQRCSYAAVAVTMGCYIWLCLNSLPRDYGSELPFYKKQCVLKSLCAAHGLIADIFIFSFSFTLYKAPRPSVTRLVFTTVNAFINMVALVYYTVLHQIFVRYLFTVWLATFQDDWSSKTHNKRWWTIFKRLGGSTPDTAFEDELVSHASFGKWYNPLAKPFRMLETGFGLFGEVDDRDHIPYI